ncbi:MAG: TrmH family RNA methyltransferase [Bdellovibrio sp.]|nr:TrmH family RNA methyltransferase [Bdellovibrio sp.]
MKSQLEEIHRLFIGLALDSKDGDFDPPMLEQLVLLIAELENADEPILKKLSKYKDHLPPTMTLRHFSGIGVPFERYLKKSIQDDDFVVTDKDRDHLVTARVPLQFIVDNMRSAFNVGSLFRTADTLGAQKIWLTGYSPTPHQLQVERSALGATLILDWETCSFTNAIEKLRAEAYHIIALETAANALDIAFPYTENKPTAFVIGNERFGLDADQLKMCHEVRKIPTFGIKNSLNAATAAAIAGYEWRKQWNEFPQQAIGRA